MHAHTSIRADASPAAISSAMPADCDDSALLAKWREYREAVIAFNANGWDGGDEENCPLQHRHEAAFTAMEGCDVPQTLAGVIARLRFAFVSIILDARGQSAALSDNPEDLAAYYRDHPGMMDDTEPHIAAAIIALQKMEA